jgi:formylglycine-generating enzyme required for sulfatase activity
MEPVNKRKSDIKRSLFDNLKLLSQWERHLATATDPTQEQRARDAIKRIRALIEEQQQEHKDIRVKRRLVILMVVLLVVAAISVVVYDSMKGDAPATTEQLQQVKKEDSLALMKTSSPAPPKEGKKKEAKVPLPVAPAAVKNIPKATVRETSFTMGIDEGNPDNGPAHLVTLHHYAIGKTEVTVSQYRNFCTYTGRPMPPPPPYGWKDDGPIVNVSWYDAVAYCQWVGGRLPTEAEWEYAASGGGTNTYSGSNRVNDVAVYNTNSRGKPGLTAQKNPNAFDLYDMTGNVFEWCADWYSQTYYAQREQDNPKGPASGTHKVIRGGAYNSFVKNTQDGNQLKITYRNREVPAARQPHIGFRVAWDL